MSALVGRRSHWRREESITNPTPLAFVKIVRWCDPFRVSGERIAADKRGDVVGTGLLTPQRA
jgi:hypothetical protein